MELKLVLSVFVLYIEVSLAVLQHVTVMEGENLSLSCPVTNADKTNVDWKNPKGFVMFFNHNQALKDKRYRIDTLSESKFSISVSSVKFNDGGNYTCSHYGDQITEKIVEVTVLGYPKMSKTKHEGKTVIKCTAVGNHFAPQISWKIDDGSEFLARNQFQQEAKKYISTGMIEILSVEKRVTVKCLVRHPALKSKHLMNFVIIRRDSKASLHTSTVSPHTVKGSTKVPGTTTMWIRHNRTAVYSTTRNENKPLSESSTVPSSLQASTSDPEMSITRSPQIPVTGPTDPHLSTSGWTYSPETTENITIDNMDSNTTGNFDLNMHRKDQENSSLLVLLVTCLICGLLVVVIFFAIKLRRAHIAWKRENEDSNPSEESSKSKSSHEEKTSQAQRRRGLFNTAFTQYVVEEPAKTMTSVQNTAVITATTSQHQTTAQTLAKCDAKETSL
ncbi:cytotoxic and regulatory T-cell molecule [Pundamilia nyererei]|uniref:Cytotoxic and regulatory T-cell molecule n=2 Tax=Pundamilia nyererei TaxID=303518 RepID=A0A9Y3S9I1_9CICH|nr:PREDICTED: cytotoxic and regulatory T-cell molecule [Pundamilia nyererei]